MDIHMDIRGFRICYGFMYGYALDSRTREIKLDTVKPGHNALEGTGPRERYRRESVIRGK